MKKIININLSGRVIPIEDTAYEKLQAYIESLRRYFSREEGRDEIINDIESRIAELMNEKIRKGSAAVTDEDVAEIISSMGRVEDFEAVDQEEKTDAGNKAQTSGFQNTYERRSRSRLYRDSSDKILGGVCSGIANYLNVDPAIVRILFAIITFGGFGIGILAYILLWIILPPMELEGFYGKRLYRNPDDRVIAGVAGGLAAYFGRSSSLIRLIFASPILLNILLRILSWPFFDHGSFVPNIVFGSLSGTFILAYVVLWIVLPEAASEYQKMEMRGERVDVNRIRQNVQEGIGSMKEKMKSWGNEVKDSAQNLGSQARQFADTRGKAFVHEAGYAAGKAGRGVFHVIGVIFKAFFLFIVGAIAFALFVALLGILIGGVSVWPIKDFLLDGFWQNFFGMATLILFFGVPLIGFIVWLLRRIMRVRSHNNYLGWTFGGLWTLGWISLFIFAGSLFNDFRSSNIYNRDVPEMNISQPANGKMIVKVSEPEVFYTGTFPWLDIDGKGFDITRDTMRYANIRIEDVMKSDDGNYHVQIVPYSRGENYADAQEKANKIVFSSFFKDSVLDLGSHISIDKATKFRGQQISVLVKVPVGKKIRFDNTIDKLHAFNIKIEKHRRRVSGVTIEDEDDHFGYETDVDYIMGEDGNLKNPGGSSVHEIVQDNPAAADSIANEMRRKEQERRNKIEEINKSIQKLQEQKDSLRSTSGKTTNASGNFAIGPSPNSTISQWF